MKGKGGDIVKHTGKYVAPIVISVVFVLYYIGIAVVFLSVPGIAVLAKVVLAVIPAILCALMIGAAVSRIKEIRKGEEDDLGKY